jgi:riboflavin kinase/FMN adenylyltransferase
MNVYRNVLEVPTGLKKPAVSLGTFDGLHKGHRAIISHVLHVAEKENRAAVAVTYDPHPQRVLASADKAPGLLSTISERLALFEEQHLDGVVILPFSREFSRWTAERFVTEILVRRLDAGHVVVGYDHAFGHDRRGKADFLESELKSHGISVDVVAPVKLLDGPVKSSRIRRLLSAGELQTANELLGYAYSFSGEVIRGDRRGSELGFPTANLAVPEEKLLPAHAIYGARAVLDDESHPALVHIGPRPTLGERGVSVEAHLLDFPSRDLYGQHMTIVPEVELRKVTDFDSLDLLVCQLEKDKKHFIAYRRRKEKARASQ